MSTSRSQQPRCKQREIKLVALQAAGYLTLTAFAKWMLTHPLGSIARGNKEKRYLHKMMPNEKNDALTGIIFS